MSASEPRPPLPLRLLRAARNVPLLVTVGVHVALGLIAAAVIVQQTTATKKRTFEAAATTESAAAKQVEHRLQVARRGGASAAAASPVSANRIFSTSPEALALPSLPDLPSMNGGFGGFGASGSGVGLGAGTGMSTSLGGGVGLGGRGFMSLSFLGATSQGVNNVVFVVDTSLEIMEPRKGGFRAFGIIREEIMRLVGRLPPSARFNVVLFGYDSGDDTNNIAINLFRSELAAATSENKKAFFDWMSPVNTQLGEFGPRSAGGRLDWKPRPVPDSAGLDPLLLPPVWSRAVHPALEQKPDVVYVITASQGVVRRRIDEAVLEKRRVAKEKERADFDAAVRKEGLDPEAVSAAYDRARDKASAELKAINRRRQSEGKDPIVLRTISSLEDKDVQAYLAKEGESLRFDGTGWTARDGKRVRVPWFRASTVEGAEWSEFLAHYSRLQGALVSKRPALNLFLFVGPNEKAEKAVQNLTATAKRNGGTFQLLTTRRLEELQAREAAAK